MTAVPDADSRTVTLVCDTCGADETSAEVTHDSDVDMRAAEVIDSAGMGLLVRVRQEARQRGGTLSLAAP